MSAPIHSSTSAPNATNVGPERSLLACVEGTGEYLRCDAVLETKLTQVGKVKSIAGSSFIQLG